MRYYKATCVTRYDDLVATATTAEELATGFADKLVETITDEAPDAPPLVRPAHAEHVRARAARGRARDRPHPGADDLADRPPLRRPSGGEPAFSSPTTYALFDGLFEKGLLSYLSGDPVALDDLRARALAVAGSIVR